MILKIKCMKKNLGQVIVIQKHYIFNGLRSYASRYNRENELMKTYYQHVRRGYTKELQKLVQINKLLLVNN
jgi:hypothetical protein